MTWFHRRVSLYVCAPVGAMLIVCGMLVLAPVDSAEAETAPELPASSMNIPWDDFRKILEKWQGIVPTPPPPPPRDAVVTHADYVAEVKGEGVTIRATIGVSMLKTDGWALVPVILSAVPVLDARLDGKPVSLTDDGGRRSVILRDAGDHVLTLVMEASVEDTGGPRRFGMPAVLSPVNRLEVRLPEPELDVRFLPGGYVRETAAASGTTAVGSFANTENVVVEWSRKVEKAQRADARVNAEVRTLVTVGEGLAVYTTAVEFDIQHKPVGRFRFAIPADVVVADVTTRGLVGWTVEEGEGGRVLVVDLAYEAAGRHLVAMTLEQALPTQESFEFATPDLRVLDVVHENGFLGVAATGQMQVQSVGGDNMAPQDARELPPDLKTNADQPTLFGFKYVKHPASAKLSVTRHGDASVLTCAVDRAAYRVMVTRDGKELVEAVYSVANRSRQFLGVTLPDGADLWSVFRDGRPVKAALTENSLLLPITVLPGRESTELRLLYFRQGSWSGLGGRRSLTLPVLDVPTNDIALTTYLPPGFRYLDFGGTLRPSAGPPLRPEETKEGWDLRSSDEEMPMVGEKLVEDKARNDDGQDLNEILDYRSNQAFMQQNVYQGPVFTENAAYAGSMTRGALPVDVQIAWEGNAFQFNARIVDPGETPMLGATYARYWNAPWLRMAAMLSCLAAGFVFAHALARRRYPRWRPLDGRLRLYAFLAIVASGAVGVFVAVDPRTIGAWIVIGALFVAVKILWDKLLALREARQNAVQPPTAAPVAAPMSENKEDA